MDNFSILLRNLYALVTVGHWKMWDIKLWHDQKSKVYGGTVEKHSCDDDT